MQYLQVLILKMKSFFLLSQEFPILFAIELTKCINLNHQESVVLLSNIPDKGVRVLGPEHFQMDTVIQLKADSIILLSESVMLLF